MKIKNIIIGVVLSFFSFISICINNDIKLKKMEVNTYILKDKNPPIIEEDDGKEGIENFCFDENNVYEY